MGKQSEVTAHSKKYLNTHYGF